MSLRPAATTLLWPSHIAPTKQCQIAPTTQCPPQSACRMVTLIEFLGAERKVVNQHVFDKHCLCVSKLLKHRIIGFGQFPDYLTSWKVSLLLGKLKLLHFSRSPFINNYQTKLFTSFHDCKKKTSVLTLIWSLDERCEMRQYYYSQLPLSNIKRNQ